jgi:superfamily II DNA or RNA helicase
MGEIQISVNRHWGVIHSELPHLAQLALSENLRYHPTGYKYTWLFKRGRWDGYASVYDVNTKRFRVGLLDRVKRILSQYGDVKIHDASIPHDTKRIELKGLNNKIRKYDFQQEVKNVTNTHSRGVITSATGSGKTICAALIIENKSVQTLVILNDLTLLSQMRGSLSHSLQTEIGIIGDQEFELRDITCATVQSLASILGLNKNTKKPSERRTELTAWINSLRLVIHDEVHLADTNRCDKLYTHIPADFIYGLSATPLALNQDYNLVLEGVFGAEIYNTADVNMIDLGLKVPLIVKKIKLSASQIYRYDPNRESTELYREIIKNEITENPFWIDMVATTANEFIKDGLSVFVYTPPSSTIEFAQRLVDAIGGSTKLVTGKVKTRERDKIFNDLRNKKLLCVVSDIGGVGLDVPSLDVVILGSDTIDVRQLLGRVTRSSPGKETGVLVDLWKDCAILGKHHKERLGIYEDAKAIIV